MSDKPPIRLLLVEDNPGDARYIRELLQEATELSDRVTELGTDVGRPTGKRERGTPLVDHETRLAAGLERLAAEDFDLVLLDLNLPDSTGLETLSTLRDHVDIPVAVLTGLSDKETGINALRRGAYEYLVKDEINSDLLVRSVYHSIERWEHEREQKLFETLITESADVNAILSPEGDLRYVTPSVTRILGYAPETLTGAPVFSFVHPDDREAVREALDAVTVGDRLSPLEFRVEHADGSWVVLEARSRNLLDDAFIDGIVVYARDVTERKRREQQIERQRERLASLNHLSGVVHRITDAAIEQSTREEIERTVCERLTASDTYLFAWIGEVDSTTRTVEPRAEANAGDYLEGITISIDSADPRGDGPTGRAVRTRDVQVSNDVLADDDYGPWHERADERGTRSSAAIPIVHDETLYGVLNVYASRPDAFEREEQRVLGQLGEIIGHAIAAVDRKHALTGDEVVEVEIQIRGAVDGADAADSLNEPVHVDRVVAVAGGAFLGYGSASEDSITAVRATAERVAGWEDVSVVSEPSDEPTFRIRWSETSAFAIIASHDGNVKEGVLENGDVHLTVHLPPGSDIRRLIEAIREVHPTAAVLSKRQITRTETPSRWFKHELLAGLTDRQRMVLETSYFSGYFEWPRATSGSEVADSIGISPATFSQHLRTSEHKLFEALLDGDGS